MKRILYIIAFVLCGCQILCASSITDLSQFSTMQCYHIAKLPSTSYGYLYYDSGTAGFVLSNKLTSAGSGDAYEWAVYCSSSTGHYYLYNMASHQFLSTDGTYCPFSATASPIILSPAATAGEWFALNGENLVGMTSQTTSTVITQDELSGTNVQQLAFEPSSRTLTASEYRTIQGAVASYENSVSSVPVISSISSAVTSSDSFADGATIILYSNYASRYVYENSSSQLYFSTTQPTTNTVAGMKGVYTLHKTSSGSYTISAYSGNSVQPLYDSQTITTGSNAESFTFTQVNTVTSTASSDLWFITGSNNKRFHGNGCVGWYGDGEGNYYKIYPVTLTASTSIYPITYVCHATVDGIDVNLGTRTVVADGNVISAPAITNYTVSSTDKTGTVTAPTVVDAVYTYDVTAPFIPTTVSASGFADDTHWYTVQVDGKYMSYTSGSTTYKLLADLGELTDNKLWCFTGDRVNGFRIYNKAAGASQSLAVEVPAEGTYPIVSAGSNAWLLGKNGSNSAQYSFLMSGTSLYLSDNGYNILSLRGSNDAKSAVVCTECLSFIQSFANMLSVNNGNYVGAYPSSDESKALIDANTAYTASANNTTAEALRTAYNAFILSGQKPIAIQSDRLYVLRNVGRDNSPAAYGTSTTGYWKTYSDTDLSMMWRFQPTSTANQYYLLNPSFGTYLGETKSGNNTVLETTASHTYTLSQVSGSLIKWFICNDNSSGGNYRYVHAQVSGSVLVGWVSGTDVLGSQWYIVPVTTFPVNIASEAMPYGSLCLPFAVTLPTGLSAYSGTDKGTYVQLDDYLTAGSVLPASTPVVLKGAAGSYTVTYTEDKGTAPASNAFLGTVARTAKPSTGCYVLGFIDNTLGFYNYTADYLPAFKVFLSKASDGTSAKALSLGTPTDITGPSVPTTTTAPTYDLQGRRVLHPQKGVYINGGKKIIIK
jgi:hypothetical protein